IHIYSRRKSKINQMLVARYSYGRLACAILMAKANKLDQDTLDLILENHFDIKSLKENKIWISDIAKKDNLNTKEEIIEFYIRESLSST
ncbi:hypothetical protein L3V86_09375, partial [Thiotrichales bacterium 19S11-10]|nr:hypothetical protein [Thiotrichales bacterium 19S11-10]